MPLLRQKIVNFALIAVAVALIGVVIWTRGCATTNEQEARANNLLGAWREGDLVSIEVQRKDQKVRLERRAEPDADDESKWLLTQPINEEADLNVVTDLLGSLQFATAVRRIKPEEVDRAAFGLNEPRWVMLLDMGAVKYRLALGKEAAAPPGAVYLELSGEGAPRPGVVIISRDLVKQLDVQADSLRARELVPYLSSSLKQLSLDGAGGRRLLRRNESGLWRFDGMEHDYRVNREGLDRILLQFARAKAEKFIDPALAERALAGAPTVRITMVNENPKKPRALLEVGGSCPSSANDVVALRREPDRLAACVARNVMPGLSTPVAELVDHRLFTLRNDEVENLTIVQGEQRLELDRKENGFLMRAPQRREVELEPGNQRLQTILATAGELVPDAQPKQLGLDPPRGSVLLKSTAAFDSRTLEELVLVGNPASDGRVPVLRKHDGAVLLIDPLSAKNLLPDATLLKSRVILDFTQYELKSIEIKTPRVVQRLVRSLGGSYTLEAPKGFEVDPGLAADLVESVRALGAERWVADRDDGSFGLAKPSGVLTVTLEYRDGGVNERVISIGTPTAGGAFAALKGDPGVFVLPRRTLESLDTLLIDRSTFVVGADEARRVTLSAGNAKLELIKQGNRMVASGGAELSEAAVQRIVDALGAMKPEAAIAIGPAKAEYGFDKPELLVRVEREPGLGERSKPLVYRVGAGDSWQKLSVHYARAEGVDATFVITRSKVRELVDAL
jgi:hypothetical protein